MHKALLLLKKIPKGRVVSYKELAKACSTSPRAIGSIMASNKHPRLYPCYKVIKSNGEIGGYSGAGGIRGKIALLRKDGVEISGGRISLRRFFVKLE